MVIRYRGTSPKLGSCQGSAHTHMIMSPLLVKKMVVMMGSRTSSVRDPPIADNALECGDMLLQQNIFTCEILVLYAS